MATETTTSTITGIINSELISSLLASYAPYITEKSDEERVLSAIQRGCRRLAKRVTVWATRSLRYARAPLWSLLRIGGVWQLWRREEKIGEGSRDDVLAMVPDVLLESATAAALA